MATHPISNSHSAKRISLTTAGGSTGGSSSTICTQTRDVLFSNNLPFSPNVAYKGKVVLYHQDAFLLGQEIGDGKGTNKYNLIGGTCNKYESVIECAARETCEETLGIVNQQALEETLCSLPDHCILSYTRNRKEYGKCVTQYIFVFFVPLESTTGLTKESFVQEFYRRRCEYLQNKYQFVNRYFPHFSQFQGHSQFNEVVNVKWFSVHEMVKNNINTFFYNRIQCINCPQYNKNYSFAQFSKLVQCAAPFNHLRHSYPKYPY